jgi:hypothetical protein
MPLQRKLNIFQRGILQKAVTLFVYFSCIAAGALILDELEKSRFLTVLENAQTQHIINLDVFKSLRALVVAMDISAIFGTIFIAIFCVFIGWLLMKRAAKLNWSWPTTLHKAVEFRSGMQKIGIIDPAERMEFVRKQKLSVFIAYLPFLQEEMDNVRVKLYPFADHIYFADNDVFERYTGSQRLCLDADNYESLVREYNQRLSLMNSAILADKNKEIDFLKEESSSKTQDILRIAKEKDEEIERLLQGNRDLTTHCAELESKLQTKPGREQKIDNMQTGRALFWRIAGPLMNDLLRDVEEGKPYTREEIQTAFEHKLNTEFPGLKEEILTLLQSGRQKKDNSFDLRGWAMESIRAGLGKHAKQDSGPNKKS